jgi:hypothetical protein
MFVKKYERVGPSAKPLKYLQAFGEAFSPPKSSSNRNVFPFPFFGDHDFGLP